LRQVEQDLIICRALCDLFNASELKGRIAFRGGTAIHKLLFEQPLRHSEDIDLVQTRVEPIGATVDAIRAALSWLGKCNRAQAGHSMHLVCPKAAVQRLFIDEVSAVPNWERALKRIADRGQLRNVLVITTGSKAADIRRGSERLPGRKGKLARTEYFFTGVPYKDFHAQFRAELGDNTWKAYLLSGGSPIAAM